MRALTVRDLMVIGSHPAFYLAMSLHAALLVAFVIVWGHGMPHLPGGNAYEQQRLVQWLTLGVLVPWTAVRCLPGDDRRGVTLLALLMATRPSQVLLARMGASLVAMAVLLASGLPAIVLAQQMADVPLPHALAGVVSMLSLVALASATAVLCRVIWTDPLKAWLAATASTLGVLLGAALLMPAAIRPWLFWVAASAVVLTVMRQADVWLRHLPEDAS